MKFQHVHDDCNVELVLDDEKYFPLHNESISANRDFYTSDPSAAPPEVKFKCTKKFEPKIMVWIAVSENGISPSHSSQNNNKLLLKLLI